MPNTSVYWQLEDFQLTHHCRRDSLERTRYALWSYAQHFGTRICGKTTVRVSRNELASCVGVSCDRITRLVRKLHSTAEIAIQGRSIVVYPDERPNMALGGITPKQKLALMA